ncbi:hypothetical protein EJD97_014063 [Solanum chilense]|uniref:Uncharacterized protein n=1 Tax=Solanum chilense TaxID=4083 RepID=A0A6N2BEV3_SOLCI|nr:hypothetical protein EJD97_014063 [Solanum chilense]
MDKATFLKVFLVSFLLILLGSNGGLVCNEDGDCDHQLICNVGKPLCNVKTRTCYCPHGRLDKIEGLKSNFIKKPY